MEEDNLEKNIDTPNQPEMKENKMKKQVSFNISEEEEDDGKAEMIEKMKPKINKKLDSIVKMKLNEVTEKSMVIEQSEEDQQDIWNDSTWFSKKKSFTKGQTNTYMEFWKEVIKKKKEG